MHKLSRKTGNGLSLRHAAYVAGVITVTSSCRVWHSQEQARPARGLALASRAEKVVTFPRISLSGCKTPISEVDAGLHDIEVGCQKSKTVICHFLHLISILAIKEKSCMITHFACVLMPRNLQSPVQHAIRISSILKFIHHHHK
jgi:hypothetical protein